MFNTKVAVVTGSNKGIGYAIVKGLCLKFDGDVFLTARDVNRGLDAVKSLNVMGLHPKFHQLDITDKASITAFRDFIKTKYGGIDVLVNNAAIAFPGASTVPFFKQAKETLHVNYFALKETCDILFPLLKPHARVVNLSSSAGHLKRIPSEQIRETLSSKDLTEKELSNLMMSFINSAQTGSNEADGWGSSAYAVSKVGVSALTFIQQRKFENDSRTDIVVNCVHPGYVDTDMTSHKGPLTIEEGAEAPLYAALLPENVIEPKGQYLWCNKQIVDWVNGPIP